MSSFSGSPAGGGTSRRIRRRYCERRTAGLPRRRPQCEVPAALDIVPACLRLISQMCEGPLLCLEQTFECPSEGESERLKMVGSRRS